MTERSTLALHIGLQHGVGWRLVKSLRKNVGLLDSLGITVNRRRRYSSQLNDVISGADTAQIGQADFSLIVNEAGEDPVPRHAVVSMPDTMVQNSVLSSDGQFLADSHVGPTALRSFLEAGFDCSFFVSVMNPAALLNQTYATASDEESSDALANVPGESLSWYNVVARLRAANPDTPIVLWPLEQEPFIYPRLMHKAAGIETMVLTEGTTDGLAHLLSAEAMNSLGNYIRRKELVDPGLLARVFEVYLKHFADPGQLSARIEIPGWTADTVESITRQYKADLNRLSEMNGVSILSV